MKELKKKGPLEAIMDAFEKIYATERSKFYITVYSTERYLDELYKSEKIRKIFETLDVEPDMDYLVLTTSDFEDIRQLYKCLNPTKITVFDIGIWLEGHPEGNEISLETTLRKNRIKQYKVNSTSNYAEEDAILNSFLSLLRNSQYHLDPYQTVLTPMEPLLGEEKVTMLELVKDAIGQFNRLKHTEIPIIKQSPKKISQKVGNEEALSMMYR